MDLTHVILGAVLTEKAERLKTARTHTLRVHPRATKIDVKQALRRYYGVEPENIRMLTVKPKKRLVARGKFLEKRSADKRAMVTLAAKSKVLDLSSFSS